MICSKWHCTRPWWPFGIQTTNNSPYFILLANPNFRTCHLLTVSKLAESFAHRMILVMLPYLQWKFTVQSGLEVGVLLLDGSNWLPVLELRMLIGIQERSVWKNPLTRCLNKWEWRQMISIGKKLHQCLNVHTLPLMRNWLVTQFLLLKWHQVKRRRF